MRVATKNVEKLNNEGRVLLEEYRRRRGFNAAEYADRKAAALAQYCRETGVDTLVVGTSGGVDSAVVAALAVKASREYGLGVRLVTIPEMGGRGVTRQSETVELSRELADALGEPLHVLPLSGVIDATVEACGLANTRWGIGQATSYMRTALAYSYVTKLWDEGLRAILLGTTNLDEGAYIGFFGKGSDAMVDVQAISDAHKSEVFQLADHLGVPASITGAVPQGDMYHGAKDVQVFGCEYDCVELFYAARIARTVGEPGGERWERAVANIEELHAYNAHKYAAASQAVHVDVMPYKRVPGSWDYKNATVAACEDCGVS